MMARLLNALDDRRLVYAASLFTIALGLVFVFVRAPHPWGWEGIDHYHDFAQALARGETFPTTDVPWGYAYFVAFFYSLAGPRAWVPVTAQAILNGLLPLLVYLLVCRELGQRVGAAAAVLTGLFSFNTIYASTEAADSVCTILFFSSLVLFVEARARQRIIMFALSGLLAGAASQFRPNLILFAPSLAVATLVFSDQRLRQLANLAIYVGAAALVAVPWTVRNYRLTGELIPTSTHGGVQLWYGTLQTGPYLRSRAYNPRSAFEVASFDYTSLADRPMTFTADCGPTQPVAVSFTYWTDRNRTPTTVQTTPGDQATWVATVPGQPLQTAVYYYFSSQLAGNLQRLSPPDAPADSFVFFVDDRHLEDLDRHHDLVDVFDFVRLVRAAIWHETLEDSKRFDFDRDGLITEHDVRLLAAALSPRGDRAGIGAPDVLTTISASPAQARIRFVDRSTLDVPRTVTKVTDLVPTGELASEIVAAHRRNADVPFPQAPPHRCRTVVNTAFYQREPHLMRRYTALALDNIGRDPRAFLVSCAYRTVRLFVVQGTDDIRTAQQFQGSGRIYQLATAASVSYLALAVLGVVVAMRRRMRVWLLVWPIVYVTATLCFVLTNMRYTVTVQPLLFAFAAAFLIAGLEALQGETTSVYNIHS